MWIITPVGFFSIVQKPDDIRQHTLTVRARDQADLDALRKYYLPSLGEISAGAGTDYRFRAKALRSEVAAAMSALVEDIEYDNFKSEVRRRQGPLREAIYYLVWEALQEIQERRQLVE